MKQVHTVKGHSLMFALSQKKCYFKTDVIKNWYAHRESMVFKPLSFHFHMGKGQTNSTSDDGSEHTLKGKHFPLEMHVVMANN